MAMTQPRTDKRREQPHIIADRVQRRIGANRVRQSLGLKPIPVTTDPDFRSKGGKGE